MAFTLARCINQYAAEQLRILAEKIGFQSLEAVRLETRKLSHTWRCRFSQMITEAMTAYSRAARSWLSTYSPLCQCNVPCYDQCHLTPPDISLTGRSNRPTCAAFRWVPQARGSGYRMLSTPCSSLRDTDRAVASPLIAMASGHRALTSCRCSLW